MKRNGRIKVKFSRFGSWMYDFFITPAVVPFESPANFPQIESYVNGLSDGATIVDVGCGGGHTVFRKHERAPDCRFIGVDISEDQINRANKRNHHPNIEFLVGSALDIPLESDSADWVYSIASIKHWTNPVIGLEQCLRILKPGGKLLIVELNRDCTLLEARAFVEKWRVPRANVARGMGFLTRIISQSVTMEDLANHAQAAGVKNHAVGPIEGTPAIYLVGEK